MSASWGVLSCSTADVVSGTVGVFTTGDGSRRETLDTSWDVTAIPARPRDSIELRRRFAGGSSM